MTTQGMADAPELEELAAIEPGVPVLSVHLRTDPRDAANIRHTPGWSIALRNGLRDIGVMLEQRGTRSERLAFRTMAAQVDEAVTALEPATRGRGFTWFLTPDRELDRQLTLQLPPREHAVRWDHRPFISPLVDVLDRGRPTGLVLVGGDAVRLLHWEAGRVTEPERALFELELGDWREYAGYAMANPARAQQTATHVESYEQRVDEWRRRFLTAAAAATGDRLRALGWARVVLASEGQVVRPFADAWPDELRDRVVAEVDANLVWQPAAEVADRMAPEAHRAWRRDVYAVLQRALEGAREGRRGSTGLDETLHAIAHGRAEHVVLDSIHAFDPTEIGPEASAVVGPVPAPLVAERATEHAIATGAAVSAVCKRSAELAEAGGIAATLRY